MKIQYTPPCYLESLSYWLFCKWDTGFRVCGIEFDWEEEKRAKEEAYRKRIKEDGICKYVKSVMEELDEIIAEHHNRHSSGS